MRVGRINHRVTRLIALVTIYLLTDTDYVSKTLTKAKTKLKTDSDITDTKIKTYI